MPISRGPCRDFLDEFSSFVDGSLDPARRALLLAHLDCCEACLRHLKAYRKGIAAYREANAPVPAWGLYEGVMERLGGDVRPAPADTDPRRRFHGPMGAALVVAVLAMLVFVPPAGVDFRAGPSRTMELASEAVVPPTSWASVIPAALPQLVPVESQRVASPSRPVRTVAGETGLQIERLPVVPRREVRVIRVNDVGGVVRTSGLSGWPPRRPPLIIHHTVSVMPASWVAEAALRIP